MGRQESVENRVSPVSKERKGHPASWDQPDHQVNLGLRETGEHPECRVCQETQDSQDKLAHQEKRGHRVCRETWGPRDRPVLPDLLETEATQGRPVETVCQVTTAPQVLPVRWEKGELKECQETPGHRDQWVHRDHLATRDLAARKEIWVWKVCQETRDQREPKDRGVTKVHQDRPDHLDKTVTGEMSDHQAIGVLKGTPDLRDRLDLRAYRV